MDLSERISQMRNRYINHPLERINALKKLMDRNEVGFDDLKNMINGVLVARNNYNEQSFNIYINDLKNKLPSDINYEMLKSQFDTVLGLLNDLCEGITNNRSMDDAVYQALLNEINELDSMFVSIENNNQNYTNQEDELVKNNSNPYDPLLQYCNYLHSLVEYYNKIEQDNGYSSIELYDKIHRVIYNADTVKILKDVISDVKYKELDLQNQFVYQQTQNFRQQYDELKNISPSEISLLLLKNKASLRYLIKLINDNISLEDKDIIKNSEIKEDYLPLVPTKYIQPMDSYDEYDQLVLEEKKTKEELNSIYNEEVTLKSKQQELSHRIMIKKQTGGRLTLKEVMDEYNARYDLRYYKNDIKDKLNNKMNEIKIRIKNFIFPISDVLKHSTFNLFANMNILKNHNVNLEKINYYGNRIIKKEDKQKQKGYTI